MPSGSPAYYKWTTMQVSLEHLDPPTISRLLDLNSVAPTPEWQKELASIGNGLFTAKGTISAPRAWQNVREAEADIQFRHEYAHFFQDAATGVGMWDELVLRRNLPGWFGAWSDKQDWRGMEVLRSTFVDRGISRFLVLRSEEAEQKASWKRHEHLVTRGIIDRQTSPRLMSTWSVLENDAVTEILTHVTTGLSENHDPGFLDTAFSRSVMPLWLPTLMPEQYSAWLSTWISMTFGDLDKTVTRDLEHQFALLGMFSALFQVVLDMALAYPPPSYLEPLEEENHIWFDPAVKLACLLHAFGRLDGDQGRELAKKIMEPGGNALETALLDRCRDVFDYPSRSEVYSSWQQTLEALESHKDDVFIRTRKSTCEARLAGCSFRRDPLGVTILKNTTVWWRRFGRLPIPHHYAPTLLHKPLESTQEDLIDRWADLELLEYLASGFRFRCPLAGTACPGQITACAKGIDSLNALPQSGCRMRVRYGAIRD